jgi:transposase-like protein
VAAAKKRKAYSPAEKAKILAEVEVSGAAAVGAKHGIPPQRLYVWKATAKKRRATKRQAKQAAKAGQAITQAATAASNGHPSALPEANGASGPPKLELTGIQAYIRYTIRQELTKLILTGGLA